MSQIKALPLPNFGNVGDAGMDKFWKYISEINSYARGTAPDKLVNDQFAAFSNFLAVKEHQINTLIISLMYAAAQNEQNRTTQASQLATIAAQEERCAALEKTVTQQKRRIVCQGEHLDAQSSILGAKLAEETKQKALDNPRKRKRSSTYSSKGKKIITTKLKITFNTGA